MPPEPTLIICMPNADFLVFGRCGHWVQWEHAERFNDTVARFLA